MLTELAAHRKLRIVTIAGPKAIFIGQEQSHQSTTDFSGHLSERSELTGAGWPLDSEIVSVIIVKFLKRLDDKEVDRKPYGSAPVRVSAKHARPRFAGLIRNGH